MPTALTKPQAIPSIQHRSATFERASLDIDKREIALSLSSDEPCRMFGIDEILDHRESSIRLQRLRDAGVFLWNHDRNAVLGRIVDVKTDGRRLTATVRFAPATNRLAEEKMRDVEAGILRETSIGYRVYNVLLESSTEEVDTYRVMDWEPFEGSLVSIPADCSVGVGRSATPDESNPPYALPAAPSAAIQTRSINMPDPVQTPTVDDALKLERQRNNDIQAIADKLAGKIPGVVEMARSMIRDGNPVEDMQKWVVNAAGGREITSSAPTLPEMEKQGKRSFSLLRLLGSFERDSHIDAGFEREVSQAIRKSSGRTHRGEITVPNEVFGMASRALQATVATAGGFTVDSVMLPLIEKLDNLMVLGQLGVTRLSGLVGNVAIPRQTGGSTAYWVPENGVLTDSASTFDQITLTPHTVGATMPVGKQLIVQSSIDAEAFARSELQLRIAIAIDLAAFQGSGGAGQPLGLFNQLTATTGGTIESGKVCKVTFGGAADYADMVSFQAQPLQSNVATGNWAYVIDPQTFGKLKTVARLSSTASGFLFEGTFVNGTIDGYSAKISQHVPSHYMCFGAWNQMLFADWAGVDLVVDPYTLAKYQEIQVTTHMMVDLAFRHLEAFCVSSDSAIQ